jgi:hypothetical protein
MKKEIPPWVAATIIVVVVLCIVFFVYRGTDPSRHAKEMEAAINATIAKPGNTMGVPTGASAPGPPNVDPQSSK